MTKEKAIEFVLKNLEITSFDGLSISYDYIKQNGKSFLIENSLMNQCM